MDENDQGDHFRDTGITTSFSQLLFSDINESDVFCSDLGPLFPSSTSVHSSVKPPKMLCFDGGFNHHQNSPAVTCCDSSSCSSTTTAVATTAATKPNRRRNGSSQEMEKRNNNSIAKAQRSSKKIKTENPCNSTGQPKARKEKLGERIAALQQLVSPFGKTDTASVLHEAMGYIRFLHDQLQVLCSPYLTEGKENGGEEPRKELRSRGLCLVPVECTLHVASSNGADYWSPAMSANRQ